MFGHKKQVSSLTVTLLSVSGGEWIKSASRAVILSNTVCEKLMKKLETVVLAYELFLQYVHLFLVLSYFPSLFSFKLQLGIQNTFSLLQSVSSILCSES